MKTSLSFRIPILFTGLCLISMCKVDRQETAFIQPPFKKVDVPFHDFTISASEEKTIALPNGTRLSIPAGAFVDKEGSPVKGSVDLLYREFHSPADIIASGIPMTYDSGGAQIQFESAGMFEINARQGNEPVYIARGKSVEVCMASFKEGNNYNFYSLDTVKRNWEYRGHFLPKVNGKKKEELEQLGEEPAAPTAPQKYDGSAPVFYIDADYSGLPELKEFNGVVWQYCGTGENDPAPGKWIYDHAWSDATIKPFHPEKGQYTLCLKAKGREFSATVSPVLKGENFEKEMTLFRKRMVDYKTVKENRISQEERIHMQGDLLRTFCINSFGIYNCDRQYNNGGAIRFAADFNFDSPETGDIDVFLVVNNSAVVRYSKYNKRLFAFNPSDHNRLIAVLPGNHVAVFSNDDFKKIDADKLKAQPENGFVFHLRKEAGRISSFEDLQKLVTL